MHTMSDATTPTSEEEEYDSSIVESDDSIEEKTTVEEEVDQEIMLSHLRLLIEQLLSTPPALWLGSIAVCY